MTTTDVRCSALETRCTAMETQIDKFKFILKFLTAVAAALGISIPVLYAHLAGRYEDLENKYQSVHNSEQDAEKQVGTLQKQLAAVTSLESKIQLLNDRADSINQQLARARETGTQVDSGRKLQEDVLQFQSSPPSPADAWAAYQTDLEGLKGLAVRYVGYVAGDPKQDSNHAINQDLQNAAEAARSRVRLTPNTDSSTSGMLMTRQLTMKTYSRKLRRTKCRTA